MSFKIDPTQNFPAQKRLLTGEHSQFLNMSYNQSMFKKKKIKKENKKNCMLFFYKYFHAHK